MQTDGTTRFVTRVRVAHDLRSELLYTLRLGGPLALGELGWMSTYIVDALMIGRLPNSAMTIAASSLGNTIFYAIVFCAIYLLNGLETLIAQAYGQNDRRECIHLLAQSFWFIIIGTPLVMGLTLGSVHLLPYFGTPSDIVSETSRYLHPLVWSTAPLMAYMALRRFLQSVDNVVWVTISLITAGLVNWFGDYVFLFGHFGFHPMGVAGSAWGTLIVRLYTLLLLTVGTVVATHKLGEKFRWSMLRPSRKRIRPMLSIGWPSGIEMLSELGTSMVLSIMCARFGGTLLAAHQVVLDLTAFVYQVAAGLSYATVVRVGQSAGRNNDRGVRRATNASLLLGVTFMIVAGTVFGAFSHLWASLYTNSAAVVAVAIPIFTLCAFSLVFDTIFVVLASAFTGVADTRTPLVVSIFCDWIIGMPVAYLLAFHRGMTLNGLWYGRVLASVLSGIMMAALWAHRMYRRKRGSQAASLRLLLPLSAGGD